MKAQRGSNLLRKGRTSIKNQHYLLTCAVLDRKPIFYRPEAAEIVLSSIYWLERQDRILLDAAVIMPDHLHFVAGLKQGSLAQLMHSLKSFTAKKINVFLNRRGSLWQRYYHDHAVRQDEDLNEVVLYTLYNPDIIRFEPDWSRISMIILSGIVDGVFKFVLRLILSRLEAAPTSTD